MRTGRTSIKLLLGAAALMSLISAMPAIAANGYTWSNATPSSPFAGVGYQSIATSASGKYLAATQVNQDILTSSDYGVTWTNRTAATAISGSHWQNIASDSSGQYLVTAVYNGDIFTSSDYGATWSARSSAGSRLWAAVGSSSSGQNLVADALGGDVWTSANYGATWTDRTASGSRNWLDIASSGSGQTLFAVESIGDVYRSTDYGATWSNVTSSTALHGQQVVQVDTSNDGSTVIVSVLGGDTWTSANGGGTWADQSALGSKNWDAVAVSYTGQYMAAAVLGGDVWTSADYGASWSNSTSSTSASGKFWSNLGFSGSGQRLVGADSASGDLWAANDPAFAASEPGVISKSATVTSGGSVTVDVLTGISGMPDASTLTITSGPSHGKAVDPPGTITYTPTAGYVGDDALTYQVCSILDPTVCKGAVLSFSVVPGVPDTGFIRSSGPLNATLLVALSLLGSLVGLGLLGSRRLRSVL
jgi:hypothetical protein